MQNPQDVQLASDALKQKLPKEFFQSEKPVIGLVLGTGLSFIADNLEKGTHGQKIPYSEIPNFPTSSVESHKGAFIFGFFNSAPVLCQAGRCHIYEGYEPSQVCMGVRVMASLGIRTLVLTNAAGSINPLFPAGNILCISDIINQTGLSPLRGKNNDAWGPRFPDMGTVFSPDLRKLACETALKEEIPLYTGVYLGVHGPELETPAETRMYRQWGADAVGMSTVLEAICAVHLGMRIVGFSCLTNQNLPDCLEAVTLSQILETANQCGTLLGKLLYAFLPRLVSHEV